MSLKGYKRRFLNGLRHERACMALAASLCVRLAECSVGMAVCFQEQLLALSAFS